MFALPLAEFIQDLKVKTYTTIRVKYNQHTYRHDKYKPYRPGGPQQIGAASVVVCSETTLQATVCALLLT